MLKKNNYICNLFIDGPVLVHTTNGDLLRSLEAPENYCSPELCALCREGLIVVCYDQCNVCCFTINGRRLRSETHHHPIQVFSILYCIVVFT